MFVSSTPFVFMRYLLRYVFLAMIFFVCTSFVPGNNMVAVELKVTNIRASTGKLMVAFYNSEEDFLKNVFRGEAITIEDDGEKTVVFQIPAGQYTISIFHDVNDDGVLNSNMIGIPKEPYGFSNNPSSRFGPPKFASALIDIGTDGLLAEIRLK
jgi:uncharacterized protein (DUF2141 family)